MSLKAIIERMWNRITELKCPKEEAGTLKMGRWEDGMETSSWEHKEAWMIDRNDDCNLRSTNPSVIKWNNCSLEKNYHKKHTTSEKVIKHLSPIPLNILNSKLIRILGSLVLWVKDSGFPGPLCAVNNRTGTIQQDHWHQGANLQNATTALTQHEQIAVHSSWQPDWNGFIISLLSFFFFPNSNLHLNTSSLFIMKI